jgi:hypothetical protein
MFSLTYLIRSISILTRRSFKQYRFILIDIDHSKSFVIYLKSMTTIILSKNEFMVRDEHSQHDDIDLIVMLVYCIQYRQLSQNSIKRTFAFWTSNQCHGSTESITHRYMHYTMNNEKHVVVEKADMLHRISIELCVQFPCAIQLNDLAMIDCVAYDRSDLNSAIDR